MKTNFKKIALIFSLVVVMVAALALFVSAEKADFTPPAEFSDITPANGWVQIGSKSAAADDDGQNIELYFISGAEAYLNKSTKTLAIVGGGALTGNYGDWNASATKNAPGQKYYLIWWAAQNSELVENLEFRSATGFNNGGYVNCQFKNVKTVKLNSSLTLLFGSKSDTGAFTGMTSLETLGHGTFDADGKWTPVTYKEGVVDMTGFTSLRPNAGNGDSKAVLYHGSTFLSCSSITEAILPKTLAYTGTYTPAVLNDAGKWEKGPAAIEAKDDEFGGDYAGVIAKAMFSGNEALYKVTIPEGVTLKLIEDNAFKGCSSLRCITINGTVDPSITITKNAISSIGKGCIVQCKTQEEIDILNAKFAELDLTNIKAVDMNTEPTPAPKVTKLPAAPSFAEFDSTGATAYGYMNSTYTKGYWAFYAETKTLKFFAEKVSGYNEVGSIASCEDGVGWIEYKEQIEHVVIGPKIHKLTASFATGLTNLVDIEMTSDINQASGAFSDCAKLTTIFITGMERVEGTAVLACAKSNFKLSLAGTAIDTVIMGSSAVAFSGNITPGAKTSTLEFDSVSDDIIAFCQENYLNLRDSNGKVYGEWYVEVPEGLPFCGATAVFDFDEETGTLYILGKGAVSDVANYWGGGSKNQHWFSIRDNIKHVVVGDHITTIGKYAFTECKNIETVELPAIEGFVILNAAFEDCYNLKSVYIRGNQPIEGTADMSIVDEFESYTFADCFLIANVVVNENVKKIGASVFDNCVNLQNVYGVPGSYAEEYATKNEFTFFDKSANTPQPITCTAPTETTEPVETTPVDSETEPVETTPVTDEVVETTPETTPETAPVNGGDDDQTTEGGSSILPVIIIVAAVVVVAVVVVVVIIAKKKKAPKAE